MSGIGGIVGGISQPIAAHFAQKRQWKYTKKMMQTRHQWEVEDLIKAGLNPILGYVGSKGGPPLGSVGIPNIAGGLGATALSAAKIKEELELLRATSDKARADAAKARVQTKKVDIEVSEFPPTFGGVARRVLSSEGAKNFLKGVERTAEVPDWIRKSVMNAADRLQRIGPGPSRRPKF